MIKYIEGLEVGWIIMNGMKMRINLLKVVIEKLPEIDLELNMLK